MPRTDRTYPLSPPFLVIAVVVAALTWLNTRPIESPPVLKDPGPQWADGELVTDARTGQVFAWKATDRR